MRAITIYVDFTFTMLYYDYRNKKTTQKNRRGNNMVDIKYFNEAVNMMDSEIREDLHKEISPCSDEKFLREYEKRHFDKYNEEFSI